MKLLRTALATAVLMSMSAMPIAAHAQDRDHDRNNYTNGANYQDRDHDRDRDAARDQWRAHDAAYQEGWNQGMRDAQRHKRKHANAGHWKHDDRNAFNDGYNRGYQSYWVERHR